MTTTFSKIKKKNGSSKSGAAYIWLITWNCNWLSAITLYEYSKTHKWAMNHLFHGAMYMKWSEVKWSEVAQLCLTLCDPMDCSLPGSSVYGIFQARILEWVAISFSRRSSPPRDWTQVSCIVDRRFTIWATREVPWCHVYEKTQKIFETYMCQLPW